MKVNKKPPIQDQFIKLQKCNVQIVRLLHSTSEIIILNRAQQIVFISNKVGGRESLKSLENKLNCWSANSAVLMYLPTSLKDIVIVSVSLIVTMCDCVTPCSTSMDISWMMC